MIKGAVILVVMIAIYTVWKTKKSGDAAVKAKWVIPLWGAGAVVVIASSVALWYVVTDNAYHRCVDIDKRTVGGHNQSLTLYDAIDFLTGSDKYTNEPLPPTEANPKGLSLRQLLPEPLDYRTCPKP